MPLNNLRYTQSILLKMESEMEIKRFRGVNGDANMVLLNALGSPLEYPCLYVTLHHRNSADSVNTCYKAFEQIRFLMQVCDMLNIDLLERIRIGKFLTLPELELLGNWARKKKSSLDPNRREANLGIVVSPKRTRLETSRANLILRDDDEVEPHTTYNRLTSFAGYIDWLERYLHPLTPSSSASILKKLRPRNTKSKRTKNGPMAYKSLSEEEASTVFELVRRGAPANPWTSNSIQVRNELIFELLSAVGCRRGELLRIRIDDIFISPQNGQRYLVIRSASDPDDPRLNKPEAKTNARNFPLNSRITQLIDDYIIRYRSEVRGADKCPYLFVSHKNGASAKPLSISALTKLFSDVSKLVTFELHPHVFRHTWNDRFSAYVDKMIEKGRMNEAKAESDRQKLMGWSAGSKMALYYSQRYQERRAIVVALKLQEKA